MKANKKYSLLIAFVFLLQLSVFAVEIPQAVLTGFSKGDAVAISGYFKNTLELTIDNKENIYSSTQAQIILKNFFQKNSPKSFSVVHEGGKGDSKYAIGSLKTNTGNYRITILIKSNNGKPYIHQLRIEKDEV